MRILIAVLMLLFMTHGVAAESGDDYAAGQVVLSANDYVSSISWDYPLEYYLPGGTYMRIRKDLCREDGEDFVCCEGGSCFFELDQDDSGEPRVWKID